MVVVVAVAVAVPVAGGCAFDAEADPCTGTEVAEAVAEAVGGAVVVVAGADATAVVAEGPADGVDADAADVGGGVSSQPASSPAARSGATARAARPNPAGRVEGDGEGPPQNGQDASPRRTWRAHAGQGNSIGRGYREAASRVTSRTNAATSSTRASQKAPRP